MAFEINILSKDSLEKGKLFEYYKSGKLRSKGEYQTDTYIQCCFAGPCVQEYLYKIGSWKYYYENGQLMARGILIKNRVNILTSCEGGDSIYSGIVSPKWRFYGSDGKLIMADKKMISAIEAESYYISDDLFK